MKIVPTNSLVGAFVEDIDLSCPVSSDETGELLSAWHKHGVLFFKNQNLDDEQQIRLDRMMQRRKEMKKTGMMRRN